MRHASAVFAVLVSMVAVPATAVAANTAPERRMVDELNRVRAKEGNLPPLRPMADLGRAAVRFSRWLMAHDLFAHRAGGPPGGKSGRVGEALAMHFSTAPRVRRTVESWLRSPAHRALVLTRSMNVAGVGHTSGSFGGRAATIWVLEIARR